jgi:hypothetical protein
MAKYITFFNGMYNDVIIFNEARNHSDLLQINNIDIADVVGAGNCYFEEGKLIITGYSYTLNKKPNEKDKNIILHHFTKS